MELIPKHVLRASSLTERTYNIYNLIIMSRQKAHNGNKLLDLDFKKFYKNETTFTLDEYVKKIKEIFNVLDKYGAPIYKDHMVEHIIDQAMSPNIELKTEVNICRFLHSSTFVKYSMYLYMVVAILYPSTNPSSSRFRKSGIFTTGRGDRIIVRGGRFNVLGRVRGHGGRDGRVRGGHS